MKARLQVMKFGGTSLGDATCMARTAQLIAQGARAGTCVAVVSAMSGVTNRLIEAAQRAGSGEKEQGTAVLERCESSTEVALISLVGKGDAWKTIEEG
jgi:aspartokinase